MDPNKVRITPNPRETANIINRIFFWWTSKLFWKGMHTNLGLADLYGPMKADESERVGDHLQKCWQKELEKLNKVEYTVGKDGEKKIHVSNESPSFLKALLRAFWIPFFSIGLLELVQAAVLRVLPPVLQGYILKYFNFNPNGKEVNREEALIYSGCMSISLFAIVLATHHSNLFSQQLGMRMRTACSSLIYRKMLRLSKKALTETTAGQVVNLLSNDVSRFDELPGYLHYIWIMPIQVVVISSLMWQKLGYATIVGVGSMLVLTLSVNSIFTVLSRVARAKIAVITDRRVQLMNELISGIQVIKMYAWEVPFANIVARTRAAEMAKVKSSSFVRAVYLSIIVFTERTILYIALVSFVCMGNDISPDITYVLAMYFNILQLSTALYLPHALILCGEVAVSIKRIEQFLLLNEKVQEEESDEMQLLQNGAFRGQEMIRMNGQVRNSSGTDDLNKSVFIELHRVCANWTSSQLPPTLCNITAEIKGGQLCAMIGPVGSGKTSFLHLLLRELPLGAGTLSFSYYPYISSVDKKGVIFNVKNLKISYASQEAWLFSSTVKDNILFGEVFDEERYKAVTRVCALTKDFRQLPHGDMTLVGEGGSSLSGGQQARVNLARAVYRQADVYILDDPLSAVDTRVAKHLFNKCIKGYLHGKTRILVTHQLQFVDKADNILVLDRGSVKMQGSYAELSCTNKEFSQMINQIKVSNETASQRRESEASNKTRESFTRRRSVVRSISVKSTGTVSVASYEEDCDWVADVANQEEIAEGRLPNKIYATYFNQGGSKLFLTGTVIFFIISQVTISGSDYWVSYWTNLEIVRSTIKHGTPQEAVFNQYGAFFNDSFLSSIFTIDSDGLLTTKSAIYLYTFLIIACIAVCLIRSFLFMAICICASRNLHNTMFTNVLQATMRFFNDNSSGRILNRFSKDVGSMDELLPKVMLETIQIFLLMAGILCMVVIVNYWMLIPLVILGVAFFFIRLYFLQTAQNIKRLEGIAKSPVFSHVNTTLNGLTTIRSTGDEIQVLLRKKFDRLQDVHSGAWYLTIATTSAFGLLLDVIACIFISCVCFSFILMDDGNTLGGNVGLAISQSLIIAGTLQYGIKQSAEVLSNMTAVERILEYTNLPKEGPLKSSNPPPPSWPSKGKLTMKNVSLRYKQDDTCVLKDLNVTIESGWKIGVVGRTGAGKSSLIAVLFRLYAEGTSGEIQIDDRDTDSLGLHELRSRISIIPQEPVIFSESLRYNLDPFSQYDDIRLWEVLREVKLSDATLDQKVLQSGSNFSVGQRQLICLARAILKNNRILVLDEATANIDSNTDAFIQETIKEKFCNCTVITIAHRLNTIIDSDRIIVMEAGRIVEFGCPYELLQNNPKGIFAEMVNKTGSGMARLLKEQAEKACLKNTALHSLDLTEESLVESDDIKDEYTL